MKNKILTTVFISAGLFFSQGGVAVVAITPAEVVTLVNQERSDAGLSPLTESALLDTAAQAKADDMAKEQYFSHTSPSGVTPWEWFRSVKYEYRYAGENLAIHFRDALSQEHAWMESRKHCENIMSPKYREIGVAVRDMAWEGRQTTVAVQLFGTQMNDEHNLNLLQKGVVTCPKVIPSVPASSMPNDANGSIIGALSTTLSEIALHYKIDTARLLILSLIALMQGGGFIVIVSLALRERWLRKW